jgi:ArsR family transcriptional regulator, arsenate/arsenite/antimonite-responsive transcriptional repressor
MRKRVPSIICCQSPCRYARACGTRKRTLERELDRTERSHARALLDAAIERCAATRHALLATWRGRDLFGERYAPSAAERAEAMAPVLSALADPTRLRIVSILLDAPDGSCCGCDMEQPLGLSQPTISHHLRVLREAGLVEGERQGRWVHYRVVPDRLAEVANALLPQAVLS